MRCKKCGTEMCFRTYRDVFNCIEVCPKCGWSRPIKNNTKNRTSEYVPNKGKYQTCTLIPMTHYDWGGETQVFVDKDDQHPDPLDKLTWGYDIDGNGFPGDWNGKFSRNGKPFTFRYSIEGAWGARQEKEIRHVAIVNAIAQYMSNIIQLRKTKKSKKKKVKRK